MTATVIGRLRREAREEMAAAAPPERTAAALPPLVGPLPVFATLKQAFVLLFDNARPMGAIALLLVFFPFVLDRYTRETDILGLFGQVYSAFSPFPMLLTYFAAQAILIRYAIVALEGGEIAPGPDALSVLRQYAPLAAAVIFSWSMVAIGLMIFILPGLVAFAATAVAIPVLVDERGSGIDSIKRSLELTRGARWRVGAVVLLMCAIFAAEVSLLVLFRVKDRLMALGEPIEILFTGAARTASDMLLAAIFAALYVGLKRIAHGSRGLTRVFG